MRKITKIYIAVAFATSFLLVGGVSYAKQTLEVGDYEIVFDTVREADTDGNGTTDRWSYYQGEALAATAYDEDGDGKSDLWLRYRTDGTVDLELADSDSNGKPDIIMEIAANEKAEIIYNANDPAVPGASSGWLWSALKLAVLGGLAYFAYRKNILTKENALKLYAWAKKKVSPYLRSGSAPKLPRDGG
ncbi:MAG: hypothetical protein Q7S28_04130 [bacterium]|nr:hypothetical protein [bacterium]